MLVCCVRVGVVSQHLCRLFAEIAAEGPRGEAGDCRRDLGGSCAFVWLIAVQDGMRLVTSTRQSGRRLYLESVAAVSCRVDFSAYGGYFADGI